MCYPPCSKKDVSIRLNYIRVLTQNPVKRKKVLTCGQKSYTLNLERSRGTSGLSLNTHFFTHKKVKAVSFMQKHRLSGTRMCERSAEMITRVIRYSVHSFLNSSVFIVHKKKTRVERDKGELVSRRGLFQPTLAAAKKESLRD